MKKFVAGAAVALASVGTVVVGTAPPAVAQRASYYGAIALSPSSGQLGYSYDHSSSSNATTGALARCTEYDCKIVARFRNGCGAVALSRNAGLWGYGTASSRSSAQRQALGNAGRSDATIYHWNCTSSHGY